ncbi:hypothetical protein [Candidatus Berkiella aquae]|uniref:Leucine rich repeat variant n=1 Tax=Candidatus Berkiella aquae TaxID=295108 RepID=A0A0Q9YNQ9_9GAMM|nr:hypothetical protein [Candidatus Berkiella aquae]MCS5712370.1 hypothetical protein [Candidatus Berkiella aquae]
MPSNKKRPLTRSTQGAKGTRQEILKVQEGQHAIDAVFSNADLISHIQSFLPAYKLRGQHAVGNVSKKFHAAQTTNNKLNSISLSDVVRTCRSSDDVRNIFNDKTLFQQLNWQAMLEILSYHPEVALRLLNEPKWLSNQDTCILSSKNEVLGVSLLKSLSCRRLNDNEIAKIGSDCPALAMRILNDPSLRSKMSITALTQLGKKQLDVAKKMLTDTDFRTRLQGNNLAILGYSHLEVAKLILADKELRLKMSFHDLVSICSNHPQLALAMLKESDFSAQLNSCYISMICEKHGSIALSVLQNDDLLLNLELSWVCIIASQDPHVARKILETFHSTLTGDDLANLGHQHFGIAKLILNNAQFREKLKGEHLARLGCANLAIAREILNDENLRQRLGRLELIILCNLPGATIMILDIPELFNTLTEDDLDYIRSKDFPLVNDHILSKLAGKVFLTYEEERLMKHLVTDVYKFKGICNLVQKVLNEEAKQIFAKKARI